MNIKQICSQASATIERVDIELLLAKALNQPRVYLYTHPEQSLASTELELFNKLLRRREQGEPVVYILGETEFYSLKFYISPGVLIPRPETELLVELVLEKFKLQKLSVLELGTGSGVIAVTLAKNRPDWTITATDISETALEVARKNADFNGIHNINFIKSHWYENLDQTRVELIISNPPYIPEEDPHLRDLSFEPQLALVSGKEGMDDIRAIISGAKAYLKPDGWILLEHGYDQADQVQSCFLENHYTEVKTEKDLSGLSRMTIAKNG